MTILSSAIDTRGPEFQENAAHMAGLLDELHATIGAVIQGGGDRARERHLKRGKLLPRERVRRLLDPGAPFLELSQLAGLKLYDDNVPAGGVITGIGRVMGRELSLIHI